MMKFRLFIGNFQVSLLKKWVDADEDALSEDGTNDSIPLSTVRKRGN